MDLCIYEDSSVKNLTPLSLTRPAFDLRCGIFSLKEKIVRQFPGSRVYSIVRKELAGILRERNEKAQINTLPTNNAFFINSRVILKDELIRPKKSTVFYIDGKIAGSYVLANELQAVKYKENQTFSDSSFKVFDKVNIDGLWINYPWDLVHNCSSQIRDDFSFLQSGGKILGKIYLNVTLLNKADIYVAPGSVLQPGVVLNAEEGPIYIADGAKIMSNSVIVGPAYVGRNSVVKIGSKIYEGTSIGDLCKVGGEIEESIFHAHSNKQHEGFLGHAYLGEWVNLGADTNNSDLKNNYSTVRVQINGQMVDSGSRLVGLMMGDHSKSGINTMFSTGAVVGIMSSVFGAGFSPKYVPSFIWGGIEKSTEYDFDRAIETAEIVMARRKRELTQAQIDLYRLIFENSRSERENF